MKKILITGASGYLAYALVPIAAERADVVGIARQADAINEKAEAISVDIEDRSAVIDVVRAQQPDAIIHCAACNPGGSDEAMFGVNEHGTRHVAEAASELGCRLVSVSSDTVLSGKDAPYADDAPSSPLPENAYAVSKARGEDIIRSLVPSAIIARTSLIYGTNKIDRGTEGFSERLDSGNQLKLFTDVIRQPVDSKSFSQNLCRLALELVDESGFINIVGDEVMSRYTFGVRMLDFWGIDYTDRLEAISGIGMAGLPIDLRMSLNRANQLGLATPGVSTVLGQARAARLKPGI